MPQDRCQNLFEKYNDILTIPELAAYLRGVVGIHDTHMEKH